MTRCILVERDMVIAQYLADSLSEADEKIFEAHLLECPTCVSEINQVQDAADFISIHREQLNQLIAERQEKRRPEPAIQAKTPPQKAPSVNPVRALLNVFKRPESSVDLRGQRSAAYRWVAIGSLVLGFIAVIWMIAPGGGGHDPIRFDTPIDWEPLSINRGGRASENPDRGASFIGVYQEIMGREYPGHDFNRLIDLFGQMRSIADTLARNDLRDSVREAVADYLFYYGVVKYHSAIRLSEESWKMRRTRLLSAAQLLEAALDIPLNKRSDIIEKQQDRCHFYLGVVNIELGNKDAARQWLSKVQSQQGIFKITNRLIRQVEE